MSDLLTKVSTQTQQIDHSLETTTNHEWSGPQGRNSVNDPEPGQKWLLRWAGLGKTSALEAVAHDRGDSVASILMLW